MKIGIKYIGEVLTCLKISTEKDFISSTQGSDWIRIDEKHPLARGENQSHWTVNKGKLKKKTNARIAREAKVIALSSAKIQKQE